MLTSSKFNPPGELKSESERPTGLRLSTGTKIERSIIYGLPKHNNWTASLIVHRKSPPSHLLNMASPRDAIVATIRTCSRSLPSPFSSHWRCRRSYIYSMRNSPTPTMILTVLPLGLTLLTSAYATAAWPTLTTAPATSLTLLGFVIIRGERHRQGVLQRHQLPRWERVRAFEGTRFYRRGAFFLKAACAFPGFARAWSGRLELNILCTVLNWSN
jgi:hypothetical protein